MNRMNSLRTGLTVLCWVVLVTAVCLCAILALQYLVRPKEAGEAGPPMPAGPKSQDTPTSPDKPLDTTLAIVTDPTADEPAAVLSDTAQITPLKVPMPTPGANDPFDVDYPTPTAHQPTASDTDTPDATEQETTPPQRTRTPDRPWYRGVGSTPRV